jgi:hypothetical protein
MKYSVSSVVLLSFTLAAIGCAKPSEEPKLADGQEDAILKSQNLNDGYAFRNSDTNEIVESDQDGLLYGQSYTYLTGSPVKWPAGPIKWWYNPSGQPTFISTTDAVNTLIAATQKWSAVCGVTFSYQGLTTNTVNTGGCNGSTVVGWGILSGSVVGYTHACFNSSNVFNEFDMMLDNEQPLQINSLSMLQMTSVHEFGHAFGMGHTNVSPAVMTPSLTTATPVADDIAGCQSLYGPPPTSTTTTTTTTTTSTTSAPSTTTTTTVPASTGWTFCANENGICSFTGTRNVRYGANGIYATKTFTNSVSCSNSVFGDPTPGYTKKCDFSNSTVTTTTMPTTGTWIRCASEGGTCNVSGTRTVRYGANGSYVTKSVTSSIACTNTAFGKDPSVGYVKACDYL